MNTSCIDYESGAIYQLRNDIITCIILSYNVQNAAIVVLENNKIHTQSMDFGVSTRSYVKTIQKFDRYRTCKQKMACW
jgi:hypothetical protein